MGRLYKATAGEHEGAWIVLACCHDSKQSCSSCSGVLRLARWRLSPGPPASRHPSGDASRSPPSCRPAPSPSRAQATRAPTASPSCAPSRTPLTWRPCCSWTGGTTTWMRIPTSRSATRGACVVWGLHGRVALRQGRRPGLQGGLRMHQSQGGSGGGSSSAAVLSMHAAAPQCSACKQQY